MGKWQPVDIAVICFVVVISIAITASVIGITIFGNELTEGRQKLIEATISGLMAIISMYVGAKIQKHRDKD